MNQNPNINDLYEAIKGLRNRNRTQVQNMPMYLPDTNQDTSIQSILDKYGVDTQPKTAQDSVLSSNRGRSLEDIDKMSWWDIAKLIPESIGQNAGDLVTGLIALPQHAPELAESLGSWAGDFASGDIAGGLGRGWNFAADQYNLGTDDIGRILSGEITPMQGLKRAAYGIATHPIDAAMDVWGLKGLTGAKVARNAAKGAENLVQGSVDVTRAKVAQATNKIDDVLSTARKEGVTGQDLAGAIKAFEEGDVVTNVATKRGMKTLDKLVPSYQKLIEEYAPDTLKDSKQMATAQYVARKDKIPYQLAEKDVIPYLENPEIFNKGEKGTASLTIEGRKILSESKDPVAKRILEANDLYEKGWIKPIPHGLAEVAKEGIEKLDDVEWRGRFTERRFGNASYEDIAKQLQHPTEWLQRTIKQFTKDNIFEELKGGTLGGQPLIDKTTKPADVRYISREFLDSKDIQKIKEAARKEQLSPDDIAIDKHLVDALDKQLDFGFSASPFKNGFLKDAYDISKGTALASGSYLSGNLTTGALNMLLNSKGNLLGLADDIGKAAQSRGRLVKELGAYRPMLRNKKTISTPVLKQIYEVNKPIGDFWNTFDTFAQNSFAEIAAHANLRRQGIKASDRASAIQNMDNMKLADMINDVKMVSLMNPTKTLLPKSLYGAAGLTNPFWRWVDTAAQSSAYMLKKSPFLANYVLFDVLSNIGLDAELQERMNLGVDLDKPFVSFRFNPKTRRVEEVSSEFAPMMNTLKVSGTLANVLAGKGKPDDLNTVIGETTPFVSAVANAFRGKTKYGKPILRSHTGLADMTKVQGDKRYVMKNGIIQQDDKFYIDEPITAAVRELLAPVQLANRTGLPVVGKLAEMVTGRPHTYYRPYDNAILGSYNINPQSNQGNTLTFGSPRRMVDDMKVQDILTGQYSQPYYPERPQMPQAILNMTKQGIKDYYIRDLLPTNVYGGEKY